MSFILNPKKYNRKHPDSKTTEVMTKTIEFFEDKGLTRLREEDRIGLFYYDFLQFWKRNKILATLLTPQGYGDDDSRFDLYRVCEYNEILGFYSSAYQYGYQVSILGVGPLWMSKNEAIKEKTAQLLQEGNIFAFGLSEREHGADIYSNKMKLTPLGDGKYRADGDKYYIGNANKAAIVSTMGRYSDTDDFVFFAADSQHENYKLIKQINCSGGDQAYVGEYRLIDYPITEEDIISSGKDAWDAALSTINIGKFQLGFSAIGISTHAFYESLNHAYNRILYGKRVTDFPHIKKAFIDSYVRILAARSFAMRSLDYFKECSDTDRRYLLYNPIQKYKVTSEGEKVIALLQNVIAAKSFEKETYFASALNEIGMLPRLEGTTHVNIMQIIKFMKNYLFNPVDYPKVERRFEAGDDSNVFHQYAGKTSQVTFHDFYKAYEGKKEIPNVALFLEKIETFKQLLIKAGPDEKQMKNIDFMLNIGEIFSLIVYGNLIMENLEYDPIPEEVVNRLYEVLTRDLGAFALDQITNFDLTEEQEKYFYDLIKKPILNFEQSQKIWEEEIIPLVGTYEMNK